MQDIETDNLTDEEVKTLHRFGFLVTSVYNERREMRNFADRLNSSRTDFAATVVMNLDCNLACTYCFEGKRRGKHYMSQETVDALIEFIKKAVVNPDPTPPSMVRGKGGNRSVNRQAKKDEINLTFYGGEPLLSMKLIVHISKKLQQFAEMNGITYSFSLITNGTLLTASTVKQLKPLGLMGAKITLDGPMAVHDQCRPFVSGKGSFNLIFNNIKAVSDLVDIQIGGNFTRENYVHFPLLLDAMIESGVGPERIAEVRFDAVMNESPEFGPPDFQAGCLSANEPWLWEARIFLREEILRRGYRTPRIMPVICMMDQTNDLVVNYDGSIFKCPGLIGRKEFCVGDLQAGLQDCQKSHNLGNYKNDECLDCAYLPLCFGGCRYIKLIRDGNVEGVDCCKPYYDATLEAFVLQDIAYPKQTQPIQA